MKLFGKRCAKMTVRMTAHSENCTSHLPSLFIVNFTHPPAPFDG